MAKVDSQMQQIYQNCTTGKSSQGNQVCEREAYLLIKRAEEINTASSSSFHYHSHKGNKYLLTLMNNEKPRFSKESQNLINQYIKTGQMPKRIPAQGYTSRSTRTQPTNPSRSGTGASTTSNHSSRNAVLNAGSSGGHRTSGTRRRTGGTTIPHVRGNASTNRPASNGNGVEVPTSPTTRTDETTPTTGVSGNLVLDFVANKKTWRCHWFPMQDRTRPGGDPVNNLFAEGGALSKLDQVTGGKSRDYEYQYNRKAWDDGDTFHWWGHCNNASEVACVLQEPKHGVVMKAQDGSEVTFTTTDIQGLLVKMSPCLINKVDFKGERFDSPARDDINEPSPQLFVEVMKQWGNEGMPFVLDIDRSSQVWNFPYDQCKISESTEAPAGFDATVLPSNGSVKYYQISMSGTGFPEKARAYECYMQYDSSGNVVSSGWIKTPNTHNNPDFMWRPHAAGDLMDKSSWQLRNNPNNPEVDPQVIYDIYMKSLA